ncbi:MAG TPA: cobalt ECF transporter T component CbiQ [Spirochaetota bacterium]|nr:cobalt ECF transporter T component CbiQ [Spirochaetota bacterium]HPI88000.1 cobalt ECF transporter T component CbiQ [Spirochaetota bacterium]HPR46710.1 cobalt ECF transporter T component CbiQ [Spirochaetota bacterium]
MDLLSYRETAVHRLDPRAKLVTTLVFLVCVVSFHKYQLLNLFPYFLFPVYLLSAGDIPSGYIMKKVLVVSPFALMVAVFNPVFDTAVITHIGPLPVTGGWVSFFSIMVRFALTVGTVLALIACTGFYGICNALGRLGLPRVFVVQLLFLYRYIFVLVEETARMLRARDLRSFKNRGRGLRVYGPLAGTLLLRSIDQAQKIHRAMVCRGFDGSIRISGDYHFGWREYVFMAQWMALFTCFRLWNVPQIAGDLFARLFS